MENQEANEETVYDHFTEGKWTFLIAGYQQFNKNESVFIPYIMYRGIIIIFHIYLICMILVAVVISFGNVVATIQAIHFDLVVTVSFLGLVCRLSNYELLEKSMEILRSGVYHYNDEHFDDEHRKIMKKRVVEIRNMNKMFRNILVIGCASNVFMVPAMQFLILDEDTTDMVLNPYLPQPIYMPFNTRTVIGYVAGFVINIVFIVWFTAIILCMDYVYVSCTLQLKAQFEILNYSLSNLEKRAYLNTIKKNRFLKDTSNQALYGNSEFQKSLYNCLRSNIQHHQELVKLKYAFHHYIGLIFLIVVTFASFILAAQGFVIMEKPKSHVLANFLISMFCSMVYTLHYCWYGEELTTESAKVYYSLYSTPWHNCDFRFKKILSITISNTRNPIQNKTVGFDIPASLSTAGSIITTMYQIMNIVRNKN